MEKTHLTAEQIYKKNRQKAKIFSILTPVAWFLFLTLTIVFLCLAMRNSLGNVVEILELLDKEKYTGKEIRDNYARLAERWGEWEIAGEDNGIFAVRYIDVSAAMFSGLMFTYTILAAVSLTIAIVLGKIIFPALAKMYRNSNDEMVDLATLKSANQIEKMSHKNGKEWF